MTLTELLKNNVKILLESTNTRSVYNFIMTDFDEVLISETNVDDISEELVIPGDMIDDIQKVGNHYASEQLGRQINGLDSFIVYIPKED